MDRCTRHGRETRVTCSNCGDPICPACMVDTAVGIKCPACAAPSAGVRRSFRRGSLRAWGAGLGAGIVLGLLFAVLRFNFFRGFLTGLGVSEAVLRAGGRRGDPSHLWAGLIGTVLGQVSFWWALAGRPVLDPARLADLALLIGLAVVYFRLR